MAETDYFSAKITDASNEWRQLNLTDDIDRAFKSVVVINDSDTLELQIRLNDMSANIIYIPYGEGVSVVKEVYRIFYSAPSGNPVFRIIAD